jgi:hypothetical protein
VSFDFTPEKSMNSKGIYPVIIVRWLTSSADAVPELFAVFLLAKIKKENLHRLKKKESSQIK